MNSTLLYFNKVSQGYSRRSSTGFWKKIRNKEKEALLSMLNGLPNPSKILELGCGSGFYTRELRDCFPESSITAVDFSQSMLDQINIAGVKKACSPIEHFESMDHYDLIVSAGALEFLGEHTDFFQNLEEWMNPQAKVLLLLPRKTMGSRLYQLFHWSHRVPIVLFSKEYLAEILAGTALEIEEIKNTFPFSISVKIQKRAL